MDGSLPRRRVVIHDELEEESAYDLVAGVFEYRRHTHHWQFAGPRGRPFAPLDWMDPSRVDGVIAWGLWGPACERIAGLEIPVVDLACRNERSAVPRVSNDDEAIGRMGAEYLMGRGFPHYAFVVMPDAWYAQARYEGYRQVIEETAGRPCHVFAREWSVEGEQRRRWLDWLRGLPKPIAIMGANNQLARAALDDAVGLGLRVPDDVAVLGVGNGRWSTMMADVPMSSVHLDEQRIGYRAAKALDAMMDGEAPPPDQFLPPTGVVSRQSTDIVLVDDPMVSKALRYIQDHCAQGIAVTDVLAALGTSSRTLETRMKRAIGKTPKTAILQAQIDQARHRLVTTGESIEQVARACGFGRPHRFYEMFKRFVGMTPGQYRQQRPR